MLPSSCFEVRDEAGAARFQKLGEKSGLLDRSSTRNNLAADALHQHPHLSPNYIPSNSLLYPLYSPG